MMYAPQLLAKITITSPLPQTRDDLVLQIMYVVFGILGGLCLIVIVWAGMKYSLSSGDPQKTTEAKNQIMYAAIGLIVAMSASAIATFISGRL